MPKILTEGKVFNPQLSTLPVQQEQQIDVFSILDEQYQKAVKDTDLQFNQVQEEILRKARYELQKLSEKYQQERSYIEKLKVPADQKRQKLLQLNNKYELAAITARSKVKPETDALNAQKQQQGTALQQAYQQKQRDIKLIQQLVDNGVIQDPHAALREQYALVGVDLPISAFRPPKPLSFEEFAEQKMLIEMKIGDLETALETAIGEEREAIALELVNLNKERTELMGVHLPEYKSAVEKSTKLTNVGLQLQAGRKPGTLAEGVWQKKQIKFKGASAGFTFPYKSPKKKEKPKEKQLTGKIRVVSPTGQTGTISVENWEEAKAAGYRRVG